MSRPDITKTPNWARQWTWRVVVGHTTAGVPLEEERCAKIVIIECAPCALYYRAWADAVRPCPSCKNAFIGSEAKT